ncbi:hypothetical protein [Sphingomonas yabuuchiae]|uniref:Lipoprotein n=1 Tax=Sphingomonas yabuuchiae TaxID=172044 RepID=A0AA41A1N0_9SPHN|nr:hypothetical protein [Sphingomonas yabuuchiae]MBB4608243.1 hypothetical protein [Sphingomonas yabuuchiae]MBN3559912.1 hypothetical protein [Sphingomonas yabuuchiae]
MRLALLLGLTVALAGCGQASDQPKDAPKASPTPFVTGGWATVFGHAPETVSLLDRMGFRMSGYAPVKGVHRAIAQATPMADPSVSPVNMGNLIVEGDAARLNEVRFSLDLVNLETSPFAKTQFIRWVTKPMDQLGLDGKDAVTAAIQNESATTGHLTGADYRVTRDKIDGGRRLVVTFTRPEARPEAISGSTEPRKQ